MRTTTADWLRLRSREIELADECAPDDPRLTKVREELAAHPIVIAIQKNVDAAPPLPLTAQDQLARILLSDRWNDERGHP